LRVEPDHVSRRPSDTYYLNENTVSIQMQGSLWLLNWSLFHDMVQVLRTHTSAHQTRFIREGNKAFLCSGGNVNASIIALDVSDWEFVSFES
jgi:phenylalanyl-tRNA synthetase alpha subunit